MRFTSLKMNSFRGFTHFELNGLKQVNLLMGRNNCGKTTALEGLFLLTGITNPRLLFALNSFRAERNITPDGMQALFHGMDAKTPFHISAGTVESGIDGIRSLECFAPSYSINQAVTNTGQIIGATNGSSIPQYFTRLQYVTVSEENEKAEGQLEYKPERNNWEIKFAAENYTGRSITSYFMVSDTFYRDINIRLDAVVRMNQLPLVISPLRKLDPDIRNIQLGAMNNIYVDVGITPLSPISVMGDGVRRMLAILATVISHTDGVVLIDEIENGFHYSSLAVLWKALLSAAREYGVQIVATTHSVECANALAGAVGDFSDDMAKNVSFFRIDRRKDGLHTGMSMDAEIILTSEEMGMEVRG